MFRFNLIKRLPKKPLLGLAVLAIALLAAGGVAKRADAATTYTVQVTWESIRWTAIDDGIADHTAEVYGTLQTDSWTMGQHSYRTIGNAGKGTCTADWYGSGPCNKKVNVGTWYEFANTRLSPFTVANQPASNYTTGNNKMNVQVAAGKYLTFTVMLSDYDATSANDNMCQLRGDIQFTDAQLQTLNNYIVPGVHQSESSNGTCQVVIRLNRVSN